MRFEQRFLGLASALLVGAALAACGGSSSSPTPVATPTPSSAPNALSTTLPVPTSAGTLTLATVNGITPALSIAGGVPAGTTVTASESTTAPANAPVPSGMSRRTTSVAGAVPFLYLTAQFSTTFSASLLVGETVSLSSSLPTTASYYCEVDDITSAPGTKLVTFGPGTLSGVVETISNSTNGITAPTLTAGHTYLLQFYYVPATASPSPSTAPSSAPSTAPSVAPSSAPSTAPSVAPSSAPSTAPSSAPSASPSPASSAIDSSYGANCEAVPTNACGPTPSSSTLSFTLSNGVTVEAGWAAPEMSSGGSPLYLYMYGANALSQFSPSGVFPTFVGTGTPQAYLAFGMSTTGGGTYTPGGSATYAQITPAIIATGLPNSISQGCSFWTSTPIGWTQVEPSSGFLPVTSGSVSIPAFSVPGAIAGIGASQSYDALVCQ